MKKLSTFILIAMLAGIFVSCKKEEAKATIETKTICKECKILVTNNVTHQTKVISSEQKCGIDLFNVENSSPVTVGNETTKWECN